jgi:hypothetical protein
MNMRATLPRVLLATALISSGWITPAAAQTNPCGLLNAAEVLEHITRGRPTYGTPDAHRMGGGVICVYNYGEIGLWESPNAEQKLEGFLKIFEAHKAKRYPVPGVGDKAWATFPPRMDEYQKRVAYVIAHVGQKVVEIGLYAHDSQADGWGGLACRQENLKPRDKEDCKKVLEDKSETQESLQPAAVELAKLVVAKVLSGKGS